MEHIPTILVAEDHPVNAEVAEYVIRRLGYDVRVVGDGQAVLAALEEEGYPFVLMDLRMPGMNGFEAAARIRDDVPAERRPVIAAMTADVTRQNEQRCKELGMVAFLTKPIERHRLAEVLREHVPLGPSVPPVGGDGAATDLSFPQGRF